MRYSVFFLFTASYSTFYYQKHFLFPSQQCAFYSFVLRWLFIPLQEHLLLDFILPHNFYHYYTSPSVYFIFLSVFSFISSSSTYLTSFFTVFFLFASSRGKKKRSNFHLQSHWLHILSSCSQKQVLDNLVTFKDQLASMFFCIY